MQEYDTQNELYHYGKLGMKWGVRRGNYAQSYSKGVKKLKKLDKKAGEQDIKSKKTAAKAAKLQQKGIRKSDPDKLDKARKLEVKSRKLAYSSVKLQKKGQKFYKTMEQTFKDVPVSKLDPADVAYGKKYANSILS